MRWQERFADLKAPQTVWAVAAIHGNFDRIAKIHDALIEHFQPGDRIIYLGDILGVGSKILETVTEILDFRRAVISLPGVFAADVVYLRGRQEDYLHRIQQLQFSQRPEAVLSTALEDGLAPTLEAYGINAAAGLRAAREGPVAITRWTLSVKAHLRSFVGHREFLASLKRAALTSRNVATPGVDRLLFVNCGLDPDRSLLAQEDRFWRSGDGFDRMAGRYLDFKYVVRGFDPHGRGYQAEAFKITLDGGCRFGEPLICAGLRRDGDIGAVLKSD